MTSSWATFGVDLHLELPPRGRRTGLQSALRDAIRSGRLHPGTRLPSSRQLAAEIGVARNTVADAYGQLAAEGWLIARPGSGTRVSEHPTEAAPARGTALPVVAPPAEPALDLRPGHPDVSSFPQSAWVAALRRALVAAPASALGYGDPQGLPELRSALAGYLARTRGVQATADQIVVCSGFTQGLDLLCRVLADRGVGSVAVESHGHQSHRRVIARHGLAARAHPVDDRGLVVDRFGDEGAVLVTPAHQFPLGQPCAPERRSALIRWAARTGGLVIEDDYDGEFRYDRAPLGALQAMAPDNVVYAGTASKAFAPGLRLGWLVVPRGWLAEVVAAKRDADVHTSVLDQLALAEMLGSSGYDRHVRRRRTAYRQRRDRLVQAVATSSPGLRVTGLAAGLHAVALLPAGRSEEHVVEAARREGLVVEGLDAFRADGAARHADALVIGYAAPPDHALDAALGVLCRAMAGAWT